MKFSSKKYKVLSEWIDYNGHMNVMYYTKVFDNAIDEFLEKSIDMGPLYTKKRGHGPYAMQTQYTYLSELLENDNFFIEVQMVNCDRKKIHLFLEMFKLLDNTLISTCETLLINVDLSTRKSVYYDVDIFKKLESRLSKNNLISKFLGKKIEIKIKKN